MSAVRLVTFDATGTLLQFRYPVFKQYQKAGLREGIKSDTKVIERNFKHAWKILSLTKPIFGKGTDAGWQGWWTQVVQESFKDYVKCEEDRRKVLVVAEYLLRFYATSEAWVCREGVEKLLKFLLSQQVQVGVISNFDPRLHSLLKELNLTQYFSFVLTSYEAGFEKPDRRIFEEALLRSTGTNGVCYHVGDNEVLDYQAAREAGFQGLYLGNSPDTSVISTEHVFRDISSLQRYFELQLLRTG